MKRANRRPPTACSGARLATGRGPLLALASCVALACAANPDGQTLAELRDRQPDLAEVEIDDGIDQAMAGYRKFLEEAPRSALTPEAMRRLADLKLEKEYGLLGESVAASTDQTTAATSALPAPSSAGAETAPQANGPRTRSHTSNASPMPPAALASSESDRAFERRASETAMLEPAATAQELTLPGGAAASAQGPLEAIALYDEILAAYPDYPQNDQVLYQKARAYDELGRVDEAIEVAALLVERYPASRHLDEIQFRRAEYFFTRKKFFDAEEAYGAIIEIGPRSDYYELALYKLGWTLYKQMMLEEALASYVTLLDHKVSTGYDFDQTEDDGTAQRIADTYRVMSLCFSDLGGAESITEFFEGTGQRSYEHRVYRHLGEFYLEKLRYNDAASVYEAFVDLYPIHEIAPHFSMRVVEIYEAGNFPKLVLASKKRFAENYGLDAAYWQHFSPEAGSKVLEYLQANLEDLANHYHALYQAPERPEDKPAHFAESTLWYRAYLSSFPAAPETPGIHYQLADLFLQNEDWAEAASEYEHIAYQYPEHERSSAAGYAAIYAHRENEKEIGARVASDATATADPDGLTEASESPGAHEIARREAIASTMLFVDRFPEHEHAAAVLGAAIDDLYDLGDFAVAIETGHRLIEEFPTAIPSIRRAAWTVIAHASFDTEAFPEAEGAYVRVLELTADEDPSRSKITENLAATIYKQGERANEALEYRAAADHFLRIADAAPRSEIRPIAEYDAAAALIRLEDWSGAAAILEAFRLSFPEHALSREATRQVAFVYREGGDLSRAADEYVRVASESQEPELRRESLLVAGDLYEESGAIERALEVYRDYVSQFTEPIEAAVVARFKMATLYHKTGDEVARRTELERIVSIDRAAGDARTDAVRLHAARSALILSEEAFTRFASVELSLPFEKSLQEKKLRMNQALSTFGQLVDYEVGEVTAAATFYMAEIYAEFSRALLDSERPTDLAASERVDYEMVLEEEAFPFEEKSIAVHEKNLELMAAGVFNKWIEKSLAQLAVVMPGRYAKFDASTGLLRSIKHYSYQTPRSLIVVAESSVAEMPQDAGTAETTDAPTAATSAPATPAAPAAHPSDHLESDEVAVVEETVEEVPEALDDELAVPATQESAPTAPAPAAPADPESSASASPQGGA